MVSLAELPAESLLKMRVGQLWSWMYVRGATAFEEMSDVSKGLRATLAGASGVRFRATPPGTSRLRWTRVKRTWSPMA